MLDPIVRGCDWYAVLEIGPTRGKTAADVTVSLTGATVTGLLEYDGATAATFTGAVVDASAGEISLALTNAETTAIAQVGGHTIDVRITDVGAQIWPVSLTDHKVEVSDTPNP